jgi:hypothetical protein
MRTLWSPPMLVSTLALVVALGGTSYAVTQVTSADIKDKTIKVKDLAPSTVKALRGATGPAGATGATGPAGPAGAAGPAGRDATQPLASGRTLTGSIFFTAPSGTTGATFYQAIDFPVPAPSAVTAVNFAPDTSAVSTDDDSTCTGTYSKPTAPAGKVCIYGPVGAFRNLASATGDTLEPGGNLGFIVGYSVAVAGSYGLNVSWAYTAP